MSFKSGFVSIVGKANVGKSTLINTLVGEKVAIVSPKPQTTRNKILGILNEEDYQIIFIDTPGMHKAKNKLDEVMDKSINEGMQGVDVLVIVLDGSKKIRPDDVEFVRKYDKSNTILVISKIDDTTFNKLYPQLAVFNDLKNIKDIIPLSSFNGKNIDVLLEKIKEKLPEGERYFDEDSYTDKSVKFMVSEIIREKMLWKLNDEIPHGVAVEIISFKEKKEVAVISANIICEKQSHKQIIIGSKGSMLKEIGTKSRLEIEKLLGKRVSLDLFVKVREDWRENGSFVNNLYGDLGELN